MFFPERIQSIQSGDHVLEIGPGGNPHPRSDVFLEYQFDSPDIAAAQRAHAAPLNTSKPVVYYQGNTFPFADQTFDYVICSHVAEHVPNLDRFIAEITRVGKAGYLEYPTLYYDYLYNFPEHILFIKRQNEVLYWMKKDETLLASFQEVQDFFRQSLCQQHVDLVDNLKMFFVEGFEWHGSLKTVQTSNLQNLCFQNPAIPLRQKSVWSRLQYRLKQLTRT